MQSEEKANEDQRRGEGESELEFEHGDQLDMENQERHSNTGLKATSPKRRLIDEEMSFEPRPKKVPKWKTSRGGSPDCSSYQTPAQKVGQLPKASVRVPAPAPASVDVSPSEWLRKRDLEQANPHNPLQEPFEQVEIIRQSTPLGSALHVTLTVPKSPRPPSLLPKIASIGVLLQSLQPKTPHQAVRRPGTGKSALDAIDAHVKDMRALFDNSEDGLKSVLRAFQSGRNTLEHRLNDSHSRWRQSNNDKVAANKTSSDLQLKLTKLEGSLQTVESRSSKLVKDNREHLSIIGRLQSQLAEKDREHEEKVTTL